MFIHEKLRIAETDKLISIVGGGGKTTLLYALAREAKDEGERPVCLTTTHIAKPEEEDLVLIDERKVSSLAEAMEEVCVSGKIPLVGQHEGGRRVVSPGPFAFEEVIKAADRAYVEADGAARRPIKYPSAWDPVNPKGADKIILVAGLSALGRPVKEICFNAECAARQIAEDAAEGYLPAAFCGLCGVPAIGAGEKLSGNQDGCVLGETGCEWLTEVVLDEKLLALILAAGYRRFRPTVLLNQADTPELTARGEKVSDFLGELGLMDIVVGSLHRWMEKAP